ncbi:Galactose-binding domain-like [Trinorchestia longiramus]|nr:Galactose-binding domain-like [Trinorchestia longiramus]
MTSTFVKIVLFGLGLLSEFLCHGGEITNRRFVKVVATTVHTKCRIRQEFFISRNADLTINECSRKCLTQDKCKLFCYHSDSNACDLYHSFVSHWFTGIDTTVGTMTYDVCYSAWADDRNIIRSTMNTNSSPPYDNRVSSGSVDGYLCWGVVKEYRFTGAINQLNFLQVDFGYEVTVGRLSVGHRPNSVYFQNVTVRLGVSSNELDNTVIANVTDGMPSGWTDLDIKPPTVGRYLHFETNSSAYFDVGELQVIPAE